MIQELLEYEVAFLASFLFHLRGVTSSEATDVPACLVDTSPLFPEVPWFFSMSLASALIGEM